MSPGDQIAFRFTPPAVRRCPPPKRPRRLGLAEARGCVQDHLEQLKQAQGKGPAMTCPCCDQTVKLYPRPLNHEVSTWLAALVDTYEARPRWVHNREVKARGGDYAKLRFFGLVERHPERKGFWHPTRLGIDFVHGRSEAPAFALLYNNTCFGVSRETITFATAQKRKEKGHES